MRSIDQGKTDVMELFDNHWFFHNIFLSGTCCRSTSPKEEITIKLAEECNYPTSKPLNHQEHHHHHQERQNSISRPPEKMGSLIKASQLTKQNKSHQSNKSVQELVLSSPNPSCKNHVHHRHQQNHRVKDNNRRERESRDGKIIMMTRKGKSPSDLEHEEVKGFEDLGFVFGRGDQLNPILLKMIPGLRNSGENPGSDVRRPYLSEEWFVRRSAPPMIGSGGRKGPKLTMEMQQKLKFWARAVASNVRQKC